MSVICRSYTSEPEARGAVEALLAAGVSSSGIKVVMGEPERDFKQEPMGNFASTAEEGGPREDFANREHPADSGRGTFEGDADQQRRGSFADMDSETITDYPEGIERRHIVGHRQVREALLEAGVDKAAADRDIEALHEGRVLVVADIGDRAEAEVGV